MKRRKHVKGCQGFARHCTACSDELSELIFGRRSATMKKEKEEVIRLAGKLRKYRPLNVEEQQRKRKIIIASFKKFWDSEPSEEWFGPAMSGIVLFPEILYYMSKKVFYDGGTKNGNTNNRKNSKRNNRS